MSSPGHLLRQTGLVVSRVHACKRPPPTYSWCVVSCFQVMSGEANGCFSRRRTRRCCRHSGVVSQGVVSVEGGGRACPAIRAVLLAHGGACVLSDHASQTSQRLPTNHVLARSSGLIPKRVNARIHRDARRCVRAGVSAARRSHC